MASASDVPDTAANDDVESQEYEPLLGRPGDVAQRQDSSFIPNLWMGTAVLAQAGIWILTAIVWASVFTHDIIFFSGHPLLNSSGILLVVQSILILQPTHTAEQKYQGALTHATANNLSGICLFAGLVIILKNKLDHNGTHFESPHAVLGLISYVLLLAQISLGITMFFLPAVWGGVSRARSVWKYHRWLGYITLVTMLATVCAATQTTYNKSVLNIRLWAILTASVLTVVGVFPRIKKQKMV